MNVTDVKKQIQTNALDSFYVFVGTEFAIQNIYISKIAAVKNQQIARADNVAGIASKLKSNSLFNKSYCYVVRDDDEFVSAYENAKNFIDSINDNTVILLYTKLTKTRKFYNAFKERIVEFTPMNTEVLVNRIQRQLNLSDNNCKMLIEDCGNNYDRILFELDKISQLMKDDTSADDAFIQLCRSGAIYKPPKDRIFDFATAVLKKQMKRAWDLLDECEEVGTNALQILSVLYTNIKQVLQVQYCKSSAVEKTTGLTAWQIKCTVDKCGYYSAKELVRLMNLIYTIQKEIKTGKLDESIAISFLLTQI